MTEIEKAVSASRKRILVVDDSSLVRLYCRDALEKAGFEVEQAINGIEAMEKVLAQRLRPGDRRRQHAEDGRLFLSSRAPAQRSRRRDPSGADDHHRGRRTGHRRRQGCRREFLSRQAGVGSRPAAPRRRAYGSAEMNALHEQFVAEARELIQQATDDLIVLEREGFADRADRPCLSRLSHAQGLRRRGRIARDELDAACRGGPAGGDPWRTNGRHIGRHRPRPGLSRSGLAVGGRTSKPTRSLPSHAGEDARAMAAQLRALLSESSRKEQRPSAGQRSAIAAGGAAIGMGGRLDSIPAREGFQLDA